jgi:hypothetical protein
VTPESATYASLWRAFLENESQPQNLLSASPYLLRDIRIGVKVRMGVGAEVRIKISIEVGIKVGAEVRIATIKEIKKLVWL